jgi:hypothetical protein
MIFDRNLILIISLWLVHFFTLTLSLTYEDPRDAEEAQYRLDRQRLFGRELEVEFARGDRKSKKMSKTKSSH